jgi:hypothetical protein
MKRSEIKKHKNNTKIKWWTIKDEIKWRRLHIMHSETTFKSRSTFERMTLLDEEIKCTTGSRATKKI